MIGLGMATDADTVLHYLMDELSGPYVDVVGGFNCAAYGLATETWREGRPGPSSEATTGCHPSSLRPCARRSAAYARPRWLRCWPV